MPNKKIKLISFDLDDTLWDGKNLIRQAHQAMHDWLDKNHADVAASIQLDKYFALRQDVLSEHPQHAHHLTFIRKEVLRRAFINKHYSPEQAQLHAEKAFAIFYQHRNKITFFPHVLHSLSTLKKHYLIAVLTNGNADPITTGLHAHLDFFFSAEHLGIAKPDPGFYSALLDAAQLSAEQCVHIGDHPQLDVIAAKKMGMKAIWFNPEGYCWQEDIQADREINNFYQLDKIINSL